ncbi:unnamed protein product [Kluyveromyces dobzhanskii CBS 2104]|uniref:WGS project CCBQ000000000 data, contig 00098 n=1 Tax=Kluyveromyces dobzhanskii CBS 2104 TaxID=1427455 RepID=A0A0A8L302_9SACH|nr:unnamed protein product [Kluyveromyces dobzhanskii CBS 2104]
MQRRSPVKKRPVLTTKNVNIIGHGKSITKPISTSNHGSPRRIRTKLDVERALQSSPVRQVSPVKKSSEDSSAFTFYEESEEDRALTLMKHLSLRRKAVHDENELELENINQKEPAAVRSPNRMNRGLAGKPRTPLQDLDIELFPGTIQYRNSQQEHRLNLHMSHPRKLPEYITPPRNAKLRDFFACQGDLNGANQPFSKTTDDINPNKVVRKLQFCIEENS